MTLFKRPSLNLFSVLVLAALGLNGCASRSFDSAYNDGDTQSNMRFPAAERSSVMCGYISNPTPANYFIADRDGSWTIAVQGGHQADGDVPYAPTKSDAVLTNGGYGYWCGCIEAFKDESDPKDKKIARIVAGEKTKGLPLKTCLADKSLNQDYVPRTIVHSNGKAFTECLDPDESRVGFNGREVCVSQDGHYYYISD